MRSINRAGIEEPFISPTGEKIYELIGRPVAQGSASKHSIAEVVIDSGEGSPSHLHRTHEETYYGLRGEGDLVVDGVPIKLVPGQAVLIKPGEVHQIQNNRGEPLEFLAICGPAFAPDDLHPTDMPTQGGDNA